MRIPLWFLALAGCRGCPRDDTGAFCSDGEPQTFYQDQDGDGFGDPDAPKQACEAGTGLVADNTDCDDENDTRAAWVSAYADGDSDGFGTGAAQTICEGAPGFAALAEDCDDENADINPGMEPVCENAQDDDCDGASDCEPPAGQADIDDSTYTRSRIYGYGSLGMAVLGAGDLNGDGWPDIAVGAPTAGDGGEVYVWYGPLDDLEALDSADLTFYAEEVDLEVGASLGAGDLDGDGVRDLVIGAPGGTVATGGLAVYIIHGAEIEDAPLVDSPVVDIIGRSGGESIATDVDFRGGDSVVDLLIGTGGALIFIQGPVTESVDDYKDIYDGYLRGSSASGTGDAVIFAGDVNADGSPDIVLGEPIGAWSLGGDDDRGDSSGVAFLYTEASQLREDDATVDGVYDRSLSGEATDDRLSHALAPAGDVDGDGYADVLIGAPGTDARATDGGTVYLLFGADWWALGDKGRLGAESISTRIDGDEEGMALGSALAGNLNLDGDDVPDFAMGAPGADDGAGAVLVWYGALQDTAKASDAGWRVNGARGGDGLGTSLGDAGDMNGAGLDDLLIGAPAADGGAGAVWLLTTDGW